MSHARNQHGAGNKDRQRLIYMHTAEIHYEEQLCCSTNLTDLWFLIISTEAVSFRASIISDTGFTRKGAKYQ
jgi:hypothetical protein